MSNSMRLAAFSVSITDMTRSINFYKQLFSTGPSQLNDRLTIFDLGGMQFVLFNAKYGNRRVVGNNCLPIIEVDNIEAEYERVKKISTSITKLTTIGEYRLFDFTDPDGNFVEFFSNAT